MKTAFLVRLIAPLAMVGCNEILGIDRHEIAKVSLCEGDSAMCVVGGIDSIEGFVGSRLQDGGPMTFVAADGGIDQTGADTAGSAMMGHVSVMDEGFEFGATQCVGATCVTGGIVP